MTIKFSNPILDSSHLGIRLKVSSQLVQDALAIRKIDTIDRELSNMKNLMDEAENTFTNALFDLKQLETLFDDYSKKAEFIQKHVTLLNSLTGESEEKISPEGINLSDTQDLPPVGIKNTGNNCGMNAIIQLFANAPNLITSLAKENNPLKRLFRNYFQTQISHENVIDSFLGKSLRSWVTNNLEGGDKKEWLESGSQKDNIQVDVQIPLNALLSKANSSYEFYQKMDDGHIEYPIYDVETKKNILATQNTIELDLSKIKNKPTFNQLIDDFFINEISGTNKKKKLQFVNAPDDLIFTALRFGHGGGVHKINSPIKEIPTIYHLPAKYDQRGKPESYILKGCILHEGSLNGGHYTFLRKNGEKWFHIDDNVTKQLDNKNDITALLEKGYIFHYEKIGESTNEGFDLEQTTLEKIADWNIPIISMLANWFIG